MDSFNGLMRVVSSLNRPPLCLWMCGRPPHHAPRQRSCPKKGYRGSVVESASVAQCRRAMTLRIGCFRVFFLRILDKTGMTDG